MDIREKKEFGIIDEDLQIEYTDSRSCSSSSSYSSNEERELTEIERSGLTNQVAQQNQLDEDRDNDGVVRKLTYNLKKLVWDAEHLTNTSNIYCYCGRGVSLLE